MVREFLMHQAYIGNMLVHAGRMDEETERLSTCKIEQARRAGMIISF